jgi:putative membrane protein
MGQSHRGLLILLGILLVLVVLGPLVGGMMGWDGMGPGMMGGYGPRTITPGQGGWAWGLAMGFGGLMMLAFWGVLIVGVALLVRWLSGAATAPGESPPRESPLDILKRRYAAGEVTHEEYERIRQELEHPSPRQGSSSI